MFKYNPYKNIINFDDEIGVIYNVSTCQLLKLEPSIAEKIYLQSQSENYDGDIKTLFTTYFKEENVKKLISSDFLKSKSIDRLQLVVTNTCNLNCSYCYANGGSYNQKNTVMTYEIANKIINLILKKVNNIKTVQFFGGEPMIAYKTIMYICDELNARLNETPKFSMVSNFTLLPEEFIEYIRKYKIKITVSLDGPKEINDCLRVYKNNKLSTFQSVKSNINKLRSYGVDISAIECTYTDKHKELGITKSFLNHFFKENFDIDTIIFGDEEKLFENKIISEDYEQILKSIKENNIISIDKLIYVRKLFNKSYNEFHCNIGFSSLSFFSNGDIYPCHRFAGTPSYCMGSIDDDDVFELEKFTEIRSQLKQISKLNTNCINCEAQNICFQCPANILLSETKGLNKSKCDSMINLNKKLLLEIVKKPIDFTTLNHQ